MRRRPKLMMMACSTTVMKATGRYMTAWVGTLRCCACFISAVLSAHAQVFGQESDVELDVSEAVSEDAARHGTPLPHDTGETLFHGGCAATEATDSAPPASLWEKRQEAMQANWAKSAPNLQRFLVCQHAPPLHAVCGKCGAQPARICCRTCVGFGPPLGTLLCAKCDAEVHRHAHSHQRAVWLEGYFEPIAMHHDLVEEELLAPSTTTACRLGTWSPSLPEARFSINPVVTHTRSVPLDAVDAGLAVENRKFFAPVPTACRICEQVHNFDVDVPKPPTRDINLISLRGAYSTWLGFRYNSPS